MPEVPGTPESAGRAGPVLGDLVAIPARCPVVDRSVSYFGDCRHYQGDGCVHPVAVEAAADAPDAIVLWLILGGGVALLWWWAGRSWQTPTPGLPARHQGRRASGYRSAAGLHRELAGFGRDDR